MTPEYELFYRVRSGFRIGREEYSAGSFVQLSGNLLRDYIAQGVIDPRPFRLERAPAEEER
jgi:hypothetical protein